MKLAGNDLYFGISFDRHINPTSLGNIPLAKTQEDKR
jgi:hypothetical protein